MKHHKIKPLNMSRRRWPLASRCTHYYSVTCSSLYIISLLILSSCAVKKGHLIPLKESNSTYILSYAKSHVKVDGNLEDAAWQDVSWEQFELSRENIKAHTYLTQFKVTRDSHHLFMAIMCSDPTPNAIPFLPSPRDNPSNDWVEIDFDTDRNRNTAYSYSFSPYGTRTDMLITGDDEHFDDQWNPNWIVKTQLIDSGWQAEVSIPLNTLSYPASDAWGLQVVRHVSSLNLIGYWAPIPKDSSGYVRHFGKLKGLETTHGNTVEEPSTNADQLFSQHELLEDLHVLKTVLYGLHPALDRFNGHEVIDSFFATTTKNLSDEVTVVEFYKLVSPIFHLVGDGHSFIELSNEYCQHADQRFRKFPLGILFDGHRAFVTRDFSKEGIVPIGSQLMSINGHSIQKIIQEFLPLITRDGHIETGALDYLGNDFNDLYSYIYGDQKAFDLLLKTPKQAQINLTINGLQEDEFIKRDRVQSSNPYRDRYWAYHLIEDDIAYLSLEGFGGGSNFRSFIDKTFAQIKEDGAQSMILDLRYNYGGNDRNGIHLYSYLTDGPFTYFDRFESNTSLAPTFLDSIECCISWEELDFLQQLSTTNSEGVQVLDKLELGGFEVLAGEKKQAINHFSGPLIVLINGGSFSVTSDLCAHLHDSGRATFVGEETGGAYQGNTSGIMKRLTLPNTRLHSQISMIKFVNALDHIQAKSNRGVMPDHDVNQTSASIANGTDQAFQTALQLLNPSK